MPETEEIAAQQQLLATYRERLSICLRQLAAHGPAHAPPGLFIEVREARASIQQIKRALRAMGVPVEDLSDDERQRGEKLEGLPVPRQAPPAPRHYVNRAGPAEALRCALLGGDDQPLTVLHGMSGTGKSSLAAHVVHQFDDGEFPDGVLWGSLDNLTPNDLLLSFLVSVDNTRHHAVSREHGPLRKIFWQLLADENARVLIVLDNVREQRQLLDLLPSNTARIGRCRVLAISQHRLNSLPIASHERSLTYFSEQEALELFERHIGADKFKLHEEKLREISQRLECLPQLLVAAARDFVSGKVSPNNYLAMLRRGEGQNKLFGGVLRDSFELTIRDLTPDQIALFELIGVLGEGDWSDTMLAAIAQRRLWDVRRDLAVLVDYEFVTRAGTHRYRANTVIRELARTRFQRRPTYVRDAAFALLARYCLDIAQDLDAALLARPNQRDTFDQHLVRTETTFVQAFRDGLLAEMSHVRQALQWAVEREAWDILLRFSYVSSMELLNRMVANGFAIRMSLCMATLVEPIVWLQGERLRLQWRALVISRSWSYNAPSDPIKPAEQHIADEDLLDLRDKAPDPGERCELSLDITAGHIISGVFDSAILADVRWAGVRAVGLLCREVDIVGGRFAACDLSHSVFLHCDARRATLLGSKMNHALLRWVRLQGANLRGINLVGATLEHVDLRGADLREANLVGATLEHVDLRGADLCEANLVGATLEHVDASGADLRDADCSLAQMKDCILIGCRLDQIRWAGATTRGIVFEDASYHEEIELAAQEKPFVVAGDSQRPWRPISLIAKRTGTYFEEVDLRGVELAHHNLSGLNFRGADLRLAQLEGAVLNDTNLDNANLRAAQLCMAELNEASLRNANIYAASLKGAILARADASGAIARSARLEDAHLSNANLQAMDMRAACLDRAEFRSADLTGSILAGASARAAKFDHARLIDADLTDADLTDADLTDADLTDAVCERANFTGATITGQQLARAKQLGGAITPDGQTIQVLDRFYGYDKASIELATLRAKEIGQESERELRYTFPPEALLRFAECSGEFARVELVRRDMSGARLTGRFRLIDGAAVILTDAVLSGSFKSVDFAGANLERAILSGVFYEVSFRAINFQGASLRGASLINVDFQNARNLSDTQLQQAVRLRGSTLPDGTRYDNRFNLPGDREDAPHAGVNPDDPVAMARFCANVKPTYNPNT